jgi:hypothetical protein
MAFKLKGMGFGKGTGYKSPQMMKKESAMKMAKKSAMKKDSLTGKMESASEKATIKSFRKIKKDLVPKSRYTERTPQSQMTDEERAAVKGIKNPQSIKPTPPRHRKYGDTPKKMAKKSAMKMAGPSKEMKRTIKKKLSEKSRYTDRAPQSQLTDEERAAVKGIKNPQSIKPTPPSRRYKKSAMKKKEEKNKKSTKKLTWSEAVAYDKEMGATGENALTYGMEEGSKPGTFRVKDGFEKNAAGKVVKSPKTMKKGSAMDMKKKSAMTMKKKK